MVASIMILFVQWKENYKTIFNIMDNILTQSIRQSIRENFAAYPENYPLKNNQVSEEAALQVITWAKNEFKQYSNEYHNQANPTEADWINICINEYIDFFNLNHLLTEDYFNFVLNRIK